MRDASLRGARDSRRWETGDHKTRAGTSQSAYLGTLPGLQFILLHTGHKADWTGRRIHKGNLSSLFGIAQHHLVCPEVTFPEPHLSALSQEPRSKSAPHPHNLMSWGEVELLYSWESSSMFIVTSLQPAGFWGFSSCERIGNSKHLKVIDLPNWTVVKEKEKHSVNTHSQMLSRPDMGSA